jgi:hypothetical protein
VPGREHRSVLATVELAFAHAVLSILSGGMDGVDLGDLGKLRPSIGSGVGVAPGGPGNGIALPGAEHRDLLVVGVGLCSTIVPPQRTFRVDKACRVWDVCGNRISD